MLKGRANLCAKCKSFQAAFLRLSSSVCTFVQAVTLLSQSISVAASVVEAVKKCGDTRQAPGIVFTLDSSILKLQLNGDGKLSWLVLNAVLSTFGW